MGVKFTAASSTTLNNTAAAIAAAGYPMSFACWFNAVTTTPSHGGIISVCASAAATGLGVQIDTGATGLTLSNTVAGSGTNVVAGSGFIVGAWNYCLVRGISATNWRMDWINAGNGNLFHVQGTTSKVLAGQNTFLLGVLQKSGTANTFFSDAVIAEAWWADVDVQPGGAQTNDNLIWQLAYGGPFSVPSVVNSILEYRSLRQHITVGAQGFDVYSRTGPTAWTASATLPTIDKHPPLPYWYKSPADISTELTI